MKSMPLALAVVIAIAVAVAATSTPATIGSAAPAMTQAPPAPEPGEVAPPGVVVELQQVLAQAVNRFDRMDVEGVLANVSERYRTGPLTKPVLRDQLLAMFAANETVHANVRIDEVRMIAGRAWVYSTGEISGRVRWLGTPVTLLAWQRAPEVVWREAGRWRLIGDQQE
jgi:hypothetical protein